MTMYKALVGTAICVVVAGIALAAVVFDPVTGIGFVGKGDVQTVLGLNNAQIQTQAASLVFTYLAVDTYEVTQVWATGNPVQPKSLNAHQITVARIQNVSASVAYDPRKVNGQKQVTGFNLNGFIGTPIVIGEVPTPDYVDWVTYTWTDKWGVVHTTDDMPVDENGILYMEGNRKAVLGVEKIDSTGGLYVNGVLLPITPMVTP